MLVCFNLLQNKNSASNTVYQDGENSIVLQLAPLAIQRMISQEQNALIQM